MRERKEMWCWRGGSWFLLADQKREKKYGITVSVKIQRKLKTDPQAASWLSFWMRKLGIKKNRAIEIWKKTDKHRNIPQRSETLADEYVTGLFCAPNCGACVFFRQVGIFGILVIIIQNRTVNISISDDHARGYFSKKKRAKNKKWLTVYDCISSVTINVTVSNIKTGRKRNL